VAEVEMKDGEPVVKKVICVIDCGIVVNPIAALNQVEGGIIDGIGHAMYGELTFVDGKPQQSNFNNYRMIRMGEQPEIEVHFVKSTNDPTGLGEPTLPPAGGAIANAIHAATGKRLYKQPFVKQQDMLG
jgi:isoquinoline 1-oxidoreductase beta subunit